MAAPSKVNDIRGNRIVVGLVPALYDVVDVSYPSSTVTVYSFSYVGSVIAVVTLTNDISGNLIKAERTA